MTFLEFFQTRTCVLKLKDKSKSPLMIFIGFFLGLLKKFGLKVPTKEEFLNDYCTTIGRSIYNTPAWKIDRDPDGLVVHELVHVLQRGIKFFTFYLFSQKKRAFYESEAVQASMLCFPSRYGPSQIASKVRLWKAQYNIDLRISLEELRKRWIEVQVGNPLPNSRKVYFTWKSWTKFVAGEK